MAENLTMKEPGQQKGTWDHTSKSERAVARIVPHSTALLELLFTGYKESKRGEKRSLLISHNLRPPPASHSKERLVYRRTME